MLERYADDRPNSITINVAMKRGFGFVPPHVLLALISIKFKHRELLFRDVRQRDVITMGTMSKVVTEGL